MKSRIKKSLFLPVVLLFLIACILSVALAQTTIKAILAEQDALSAQYHIKYDLSAADLEEDCLHGQGEGIQPLNASVTNLHTCNSVSSSHGPGRENGYSANFLSSGCGNWKGSEFTYGTTNIPFYIETNTMTTARANDVRVQAELWNEAAMHDGTGQIVNLHEVYSTALINGLNVARVKQEDLPYDSFFNFNYNTRIPTISLRPNISVDTPVHEFGHLLGLDDLDEGLIWHHKGLMGYNRDPATPLSRALRYQDIQGLAVVNGRHTNHEFTRYAKSGNTYHHFCFYCDTVDSRSYELLGSQAMVLSASCTHDYQPMVSAGDRLWSKCTNCYKVIDNNEEDLSEFNYNNLSDGTVEITGAKNSLSGHVNIPSAINGKTVTRISLEFSRHYELSSVSIPSTVTSIGTAFRNSGIKTVTFGAGSQLTRIEDYAFNYCYNLTDIIIPPGVTGIGSSAFVSCSELKTVTFGGNSQLVSIGNSAFSICRKLTNISIPSGVTSLGLSAFENCSALESIVFGDNSQLTTIGNTCFIRCISLTSITIPASVTSIGVIAFSECSLLATVYVQRPSSMGITTLGGWTFDNCPVLSGIYVPDNSSVLAYASGAIWSNYASIITTYSLDISITYLDAGGEAFSGMHESGYPATHTYGTSTTLKSATKSGYTFGGWFADSNCIGTAVTLLSETDYTANITLYAKWTANTYAITYCDTGGGAFTGVHGSGYPTSHTYGTATTLVNPTKARYTFGGWYADSACSGTAFTSLSGAGHSTNIVLYAKWESALARPDFSEYDLYIFDNYLEVWDMMTSPFSFIISSSCGGEYLMDAHLRTGDGVSFIAYDADTDSMEIVYEFEEGYLFERIYLEQGKYYFVVLDTDSDIISTVFFSLTL